MAIGEVEEGRRVLPIPFLYRESNRSADILVRSSARHQSNADKNVRAPTKGRLPPAAPLHGGQARHRRPPRRRLVRKKSRLLPELSSCFRHEICRALVADSGRLRGDNFGLRSHREACHWQKRPLHRQREIRRGHCAFILTTPSIFKRRMVARSCCWATILGAPSPIWTSITPRSLTRSKPTA